MTSKMRVFVFLFYSLAVLDRSKCHSPHLIISPLDAVLSAHTCGGTQFEALDPQGCVTDPEPLLAELNNETR